MHLLPTWNVCTVKCVTVKCVYCKVCVPWNVWPWIRTRVALLFMMVVSGDTCNVASHSSSLYLYVSFAHFHCWFVINRYATSLPVRTLCRRKSLFVFLIGINIYVFRNMILLSRGPTWSRAVPHVRAHVVNVWTNASTQTCSLYCFLAK
jgi:hypothetical protein